MSPSIAAKASTQVEKLERLGPKDDDSYGFDYTARDMIPTSSSDDSAAATLDFGTISAGGRRFPCTINVPSRHHHMVAVSWG